MCTQTLKKQNLFSLFLFSCDFDGICSHGWRELWELFSFFLFWVWVLNFLSMRFIAIQKLWEGIYGFYAVSTTAHATPVPLCGFNSALSWYFGIRDKLMTIYLYLNSNWMIIRTLIKKNLGLSTVYSFFCELDF